MNIQISILHSEAILLNLQFTSINMKYIRMARNTRNQNFLNIITFGISIRQI